MLLKNTGKYSFTEKNTYFCCNHLRNQKTCTTFAAAFRLSTPAPETFDKGPFVYRLGRQIFIL